MESKTTTDETPASFAGGAVAGPEEFAYLEQCIRNPEGPSLNILKGADLLRLKGGLVGLAID